MYHYANRPMYKILLFYGCICRATGQEIEQITLCKKAHDVIYCVFKAIIITDVIMLVSPCDMLHI